MKKNFLLSNKTSVELYKSVENLPIIDYHNHLSLKDIAENKRFTDIYDLWIAPDPYKHRAMRMCGVPEHYITGDAENKEKFIKWCENFKNLVGNPLYHWSLMELDLVFGVKTVPSAQTAEKIYTACNDYLLKNEVTAKSLLEFFKVEIACPCASILDDTSLFKGLDGVAPSLRGDDIVSASDDFKKALSRLTGVDVSDSKGFETAIKKRLDEFEEIGLKFSDHALDNGFEFVKDAADGTPSQILTFLGGEYAKRNMVMQLHIGAQRFTSTRLRTLAGAAGGFASIGNSVDVASLTDLLDTVEKGENGLPKTVLFTLNPADNALISSLAGSYSKDGVKGLITQGPAWWWCDHKLGMEDMLENTSVFSLLSNFIGMTTDSRSFLSFVRHDYFRRILCDFLGKKYENGELLCDKAQLKEIVYNLCYANAKETLEKRGN